MASLLVSSSARAETPDEAAGRLFNEGTTLFEAKRYAEACAKFDESEKLDPALGTEFNIAECRERDGKLAVAWRLFKQVEERANAKGKADRASAAKQRSSALEPRLVRLTLLTSGAEATPGFTLTLDGAAVPADSLNKPFFVEPGDHAVDASAPSQSPFHKSIQGAAGEARDVRIAFLAVPVAAPPPAAATGKMSSLRVAGIALTTVGAVGILVGAVTGELSLSKHNAYTSLAAVMPGCTPASCSNPTVVSDAASARSFGNVSTAGFVAGAVLVGVGVGLVVAGKSPGTPAPAPVSLRVGPQGVAFAASW